MAASKVITSLFMNISSQPLSDALRLHKWLFAGYIIVLVFAAIFSWLIWWSGNRVQDIIQTAAKERIAQVESDSRTEIARVENNARERIAQAKNESDVQIAALNTKAEGLRADAERAKASIASAKREAAEADAKAEGFRLAIAKADESAKQAEARAVEANLELAKLKKETEPRRLTGDQKETLRKALEDNPLPIVITSRILDTESSDFADDIAAAFEAADWQVMRVRNRISSTYGVFIGSVEEGLKHPVIPLLVDYLGRIGITCETLALKEGDASMSPHVESHVLYLMIEQHPPISHR